MNEKVWWQSLSIWGGIVSMAAPLIGLLFHVSIGVETTDAIAVNLVGIATGIGGLMSIYGRIRSGITPSVITLTRP